MEALPQIQPCGLVPLHWKKVPRVVAQVFIDLPLVPDQTQFLRELGLERGGNTEFRKTAEPGHGMNIWFLQSSLERIWDVFV